jgi:hypothetical protein
MKFWRYEHSSGIKVISVCDSEVDNYNYRLFVRKDRASRFYRFLVAYEQLNEVRNTPIISQVYQRVVSSAFHSNVGFGIFMNDLWG